MSGFQTLYRSSDPKALELSVVQQILAYKNSHSLEPIYIIVPNNYIAAHLRHEIAKCSSHININFQTMESFAKYILSSHRTFLEKKHLSSEVEIEKLRIIARNVLENSALSTVSTKRGFLKNLRSLFHHFIAEQSVKIPNVNEKTKLFDQMFQEYLRLKLRYHHVLWNIEMAGRETLNFQHPVFLYGFSSFSKLEQQFLLNLSKNTVMYVWIEIFSREDFQMQTLLWLDQMSKSAEDLNVSDISTKISIQPCHHIADEAEFISQTMIDIQKKNPVEFRKFGVFLNDFSSQEKFVRKSFAANNIPFVSIQDVRLSQTRLGQALRSIFRLINTNWSRADWFEFLELFPFDSNIYRENGLPSQWSKISIDANVSSRQSYFINRLEAQATRQSSEQTSKFVEFQKDLFEELSGFENLVQNHQYVTLIRAIESFVHRYANPQFIIQPFLLLFDELRYALTDVESIITWADAKELLLERLEDSFYNEKIFETDGVLIAPISMMNSLFFEFIFIPQMNEGKYPRVEQKAFDLHAGEIKEIRQTSHVQFESTQRELDIQSSVFDSIKFHATSRVYVSFSKYSLPKEDELKPSMLLKDHPKEEIFNPRRKESEQAESPELKSQIQKWIKSYDSRTWSEFNTYLDPSFVSKDIYSATELSTYAVCPRRYYFRHILGLSIEEYLEDHHQMQPKDKGTIIHEILFRFFLALKHKNKLPIRKEDRDEVIDEIRKVTGEIFDTRQILSSYGISNLWQIDREKIISDLIEYVEKEMIEKPYWIPTSFEYRFGMRKFRDFDDDPDSFEKPIELKLFDKTLRFKGKVDRIDFSTDKRQMRVTDYKTGNLMDRKSWGYDKGSNLQLPLYLLLSEGFFPEMSFDDVVGRLISLQSITKFDERHLSKEQILQMKNELYTHLELLDQGIKSGVFFPNPGPSANNCRYCDFKSICGDNIDQLVEEMETTDFMKSFDESKKSLP